MGSTEIRLLSATGSGEDGAPDRAADEAPDAESVVFVLDGPRDDPARWARQSKRLRLAAILDHPSALRVRELGLEVDPPYVVVERAPGRPLGDRLDEEGALDDAAILDIGRELADVLAEAHRIGLAHGDLTAEAVFRPTDGGPVRVDFTGTVNERLRGAAAVESTVGRTDTAFADDVFRLGALLSRLRGDRPGFDGAVDRLIRRMLSNDTTDRPSAAEARDEIQGIVESAIGFDEGNEETEPGQAVTSWSSFPPPPDVESSQERQGRLKLVETLRGPGRAVVAAVEAKPGGRLGRFLLREQLGRGGMGRVFRAEDLADGSLVAVKVLDVDASRRPEALERFRKEARLLAEVNNPYVTNLLEINEDGGVPYLVLELVTGTSLGHWLSAKGKLDEPSALAILADVARALREPHRRGVVHRDVKPENILLVGPEPDATAGLTAGMAAVVPRVKLSDFGLARHVVESESLDMTRVGAVVGTPLYMSPEQSAGESVSPPSDVYAMGATLFHMLTGRPPFQATSAVELLALHRNDAAPSLRSINPSVSDAVGRLVEKALAKAPGTRYADAGELLDDLERLIRGEPIGMEAHPRVPACDPRRLIFLEFRWELEAAPERLWPFVSNTDRWNRAVGLSARQFTTSDEPGRGVRRFGTSGAGVGAEAWEEHPYEWVEGRRMGVLREYTRGPFTWLTNEVELSPRPGGGTTLTQRFRVEPRNGLVRRVAPGRIRRWVRRDLDRVYRRIDAAASGRLGGEGVADPFEAPATMSGAGRRRLEHLLDVVTARGADPAVVERLGDFLSSAPDPEVARLRPLALARRWGIEPEPLVVACLHGAREGLLVMLWDILCPSCRIPTKVEDTLKNLRDHESCEACGCDFRLDFANSVEMIFRAQPEVRPAELRTYCVGGPSHSPHVVAQVRVAAGERVELALGLAEGEYRVRGPQLPFVIDLRVRPGAPSRSIEINLGRVPVAGERPVLGDGRQTLVFLNDFDRELVVRVERTAPRDDALTAARVSSFALFRELFPGEVLSPGQLVSISNVTLLATAVDRAGLFYGEVGGASAFAAVHEHLRLLDAAVRRAGGVVLKTTGEGVLAAFDDPAAAVRAALELPDLSVPGDSSRRWEVRSAVHRGPAMAATLDGKIDYLGAVVWQTSQYLRFARGGEVVMSHGLAADSRVEEVLAAGGLVPRPFRVRLPGQAGGLLQRVTRPRALPGPSQAP